MNNFNLPTYEQCVYMCNKHGDLVFYEQKTNINGFDVSLFNYRLAQVENFTNPLDGEVDAYELRGLCFVFNTDNTLFKRYLMLRKFWNLNQIEETQLSALENYEIVSVYNKEDGSVINFVEFPDGKILAKSKMMFDNIQASMAQSVFDKNENIQKFVKWAFTKNYVTIWEFVSPKNRVVLKYPKTELILLKVRDNSTGNYINLNQIKSEIDAFNIKIPNIENYTTLKELINDSLIVENKEGWVVELSNGLNSMLLKVKTKWYQTKHHMIFDIVSREDYIIEYVLDEKIDEIYSQLNIVSDIEQLNYIKQVEKTVSTFLDKRMKECTHLYNLYYNKYKENKKEFAINNLKNKNFSIVVQMISGKDLYDLLKIYLKERTYRLEQAREFIKNGEI
jgi:RNA ligase